MVTGSTPTHGEVRQGEVRQRRLRRLVPVSVGLFLCVLLVGRYLLVPYRVHGDSMAPTLLGARAAGDWVLAWRPAYALRKPERWDVVVIESPLRDAGHESVKRIVGLPGEQIEIRAGRVYVDDQPLVPPDGLKDVHVVSKGKWGHESVRPGPGEYFLLGDNSYPSEDSRQWGPVHRERIRGRVICIFYPPARTGRVR